MNVLVKSTNYTTQHIPVLQKYKTQTDSEYLFYLRSDAAYITIDVRRRKDNKTHRNMHGTRFDLVIHLFEQPGIPLPKFKWNKWHRPTFQPVVVHGISYGRAGIIIRLMRRPNRAIISAHPLNHLCLAHTAGLILLYSFFWVIPRRLNFICRRFGTLFHLHRRMFVE
jgi:hypothetical protein